MMGIHIIVIGCCHSSRSYSCTNVTRKKRFYVPHLCSSELSMAVSLITVCQDKRYWDVDQKKNLRINMQIVKFHSKFLDVLQISLEVKLKY
jgi:hypothetical protein